MHRWLVAGALVEREGAILLVRNRRRGGRVDWSPPGGVVDAGESVLDGLGREVLEETGLRVTAWEGPAYEVEATAPDMAWHLRVEVHRATDLDGDGSVDGRVLDDPDGIVEMAEYVDVADVRPRLADAPRWVAEPLLHWLDHRGRVTEPFRYEVRGVPGEGLTVDRR